MMLDMSQLIVKYRGKDTPIRDDGRGAFGVMALLAVLRTVLPRLKLRRYIAHCSVGSFEIPVSCLDETLTPSSTSQLAPT